MRSEGGRGTSSALSTMAIDAGPQKAGLICVVNWLLEREEVVPRLGADEQRLAFVAVEGDDAGRQRQRLGPHL